MNPSVMKVVMACPSCSATRVRLADGGESLIRVAEQPAVDRQMIPATGAGIVPAVEKCVRGVPVTIVELDPAFGVHGGICAAAPSR